MTSLERVRRVLAFQKADRIPRFDGFWPEFDEIAHSELRLPAEVALADHFDIDIAIAVPDESAYPSRRRVLGREGSGQIAVNGYGATVFTGEGRYMEHERDFLIRTRGDLDRYPFDDPADPARYQPFLRHVADERAKGRCVFGKIGGPFIRSTFIRGKENLLADIAGDPEFAIDLAQRLGEFLGEIAIRQVELAGLHRDGVWIYDDIAYNPGPLISPRAYEKIYYPVMKKLIARLRAAGICHVYYHSDGDIRLLLPMLIDAGIEGINPVEPNANMRLPELKRQYGDRLAFIGGMCNSHVLVRGTPADIRRQCDEILEVARDGGVIIGAHSIGPDIPVENYLVYIRRLQERGAIYQ